MRWKRAGAAACDGRCGGERGAAAGRRRPPDDGVRPLCIGLVGNPNCGKTTLFNALTGGARKVGNWPGVTVDCGLGEVEAAGRRAELVDLPGLYSLLPYTAEERVARQWILSREADVLIHVADAVSLERSLRLTLELLELGCPLVLALNRMDAAKKRGLRIDAAGLSRGLGGIPVIPISARERRGLSELLEAAVAAAGEAGRQQPPEPSQREILKNSRSEIGRPEPSQRETLKNSRSETGRPELSRRETLKNSRSEAGRPEPSRGSSSQNPYPYIEWLLARCVRREEGDGAGAPGSGGSWFGDSRHGDRRSGDSRHGGRRSGGSRHGNGRPGGSHSGGNGPSASCPANVCGLSAADRLLLHPIFGVAFFWGVMAAAFFFTFGIGGLLRGAMEAAVRWLTVFLQAGLGGLGTEEWLIALVTEGVLAGVGGILTFLPTLAILFLVLALLEDSGYMARAAYVMNGAFRFAGLSGRACFPLLLGFGCTVPAVMAARTMETRRARRRVIAMAPFISCSARLPVYALFAQLFFPGRAALAVLLLYGLGIAAAALAGWWACRVSGESREDIFLMEIPDLSFPDRRAVAANVRQRLGDYFFKAGTVIFGASVCLWFLLNMGPEGYTGGPEGSFAAAVGRLLVPLLEPAGLGNWRAAVALLSGLTAKEMVVSSFCVLYGAGENAGASLLSRLAADGFGAVNACAMMVFCLLYPPCMAAVAVIRRETGSLRFTLSAVLLQLAAAWGAAALVFQIGQHL